MCVGPLPSSMLVDAGVRVPLCVYVCVRLFVCLRSVRRGQNWPVSLSEEWRSGSVDRCRRVRVKKTGEKSRGGDEREEQKRKVGNGRES